MFVLHSSYLSVTTSLSVIEQTGYTLEDGSPLDSHWQKIKKK